jgi:hypothetical protein
LILSYLCQQKINGTLWQWPEETTNKTEDYDDTNDIFHPHLPLVLHPLNGAGAVAAA